MDKKKPLLGYLTPDEKKRSALQRVVAASAKDKEVVEEGSKKAAGAFLPASPKPDLPPVPDALTSKVSGSTA